MAKKFAKINGLFNVFVLKTDNNTQYYDPAKIIKGVVDIDKNTICFASATAGDVDKKIGEYTIKENDRFVITQGGIYAYTGKQYSEPVIPDTPDTPIEDTWRPIYINSTPINELEYTKNNEYGDTDTINPIKPAVDFTTPKTTYEVNGVEYGILKIDDSYDDVYDIVSMEFGVDYNELKRFIEAVLPSKETIGNGNLAINVNGTNSVNFTANQTTDSEINFVNGDNIEITTETTEEGDKIKISAQVETPKNGKLLFILGDENFKTENTLVEFSANQESDTSIKFLAGDNITLEGTAGQLKITGPNVPAQYTTKDIIIAEDIEVGGTKIGDIIAGEDIFKTEDNKDIIPAGMTLHDVLVKILSGLTPEEWGTQTVNPQIVLGKNTAIVLTAKDYYTNEEIDLNKTLIELTEGTTLLITYTTLDPNVYQNITVSPFIGGYALDNTAETDDTGTPKYIEYVGDTEYQRIFDEAKSSFGSYITDYSGFTKENIKDIEQNQIVLTVNKGLNEFSLKQDWSIQPDTYFTQYNVYPMSNRGTIGIDRPIIINSERFRDLTTRGVLSKILQINGITRELLPYYIGIVNNFENIFDFSEGQQINSETLVSNTENGIRIEKQNTEVPSVITPTTQPDDLQLFIAVPANQFKTSDWLVSVVNTITSENITNIDSIYLIAKKLSVTIDGNSYYIWELSGTDAYSTFGSDMYKITLNK